MALVTNGRIFEVTSNALVPRGTFTHGGTADGFPYGSHAQNQYAALATDSSVTIFRWQPSKGRPQFETVEATPSTHKNGNRHALEQSPAPPAAAKSPATEKAAPVTTDRILADDFQGKILDNGLWRWADTNRFSYQGTGIQQHTVMQQGGCLLLEARAEHDAGWTSIEDLWLDSISDLRSDNDMMVEVELSAEAIGGFVEIKLSTGAKPVSRNDPASISLFSVFGEKHHPLSLKRQLIRIEISGSAKMATLLTPEGPRPGATNIDLSSLRAWKLRFYVSAGTSAGCPPALASMKLYRVRVTRLKGRSAVAGSVIDKDSNRGIPGVTIKTNDGQEKTKSNADGTYVLFSPPGTHLLQGTVADYVQVAPPKVCLAPGKRAVADLRMKRTRFGYGDVVSSITLPKQQVHAIAVAPEHIYYTATAQGQPTSFYRMPLRGGESVKIAELPFGRGLVYADGAFYGTEAWPGRIYRISESGKPSLVRHLDINWPEGIAFDGKDLYFVEASGIDNRFGIHCFDTQSRQVTTRLRSEDNRITGVAWGNQRLWVSSLKGHVYEINLDRAKEKSSLEAGIVRRFPGEYTKLSFAHGYLWGLDTTAGRICKINVEAATRQLR
jgi:hypothetical protein